MESILVTGGAGYIGSVLVPMLLKEGYRVWVLDNFSFGQSSLLDAIYHENLTVIKGDATNKQTLSGLIKKCDIIIPLAAIVGAPACSSNEEAAIKTNVHQVEQIVKIASKDQLIVFPVTNSGYGVGQKGKFCDESSPLRPISLYGRSKVDAEKILLDNGNAVTLRLATVFGTSPRMRMDLLVNDFVYKAYRDRSIILFESHFKRNYIHIRDVASVFMKAIANYDTMKGLPFNVGLSSANLSKLELCNKIKAHITDFTIIESDLSEDPDKRDYIVSNKRLEDTGWKPSFSLDYGIKELLRTYSWLKVNPFTNI